MGIVLRGRAGARWQLGAAVVVLLEGVRVVDVEEAEEEGEGDVEVEGGVSRVYRIVLDRGLYRLTDQTCFMGIQTIAKKKVYEQ